MRLYMNQNLFLPFGRVRGHPGGCWRSAPSAAVPSAARRRAPQEGVLEELQRPGPGSNHSHEDGHFSGASQWLEQGRMGLLPGKSLVSKGCLSRPDFPAFRPAPEQPWVTSQMCHLDRLHVSGLRLPQGQTKVHKPQVSYDMRMLLIFSILRIWYQGSRFHLPVSFRSIKCSSRLSSKEYLVKLN